MLRYSCFVLHLKSRNLLKLRTPIHGHELFKSALPLCILHHAELYFEEELVPFGEDTLAQHSFLSSHELPSFNERELLVTFELFHRDSIHSVFKFFELGTRSFERVFRLRELH